MNISKFIYLNCGKRYEDMIDYCTFTHMTSAILVQWCSALGTFLVGNIPIAGR